MKGSGTIVASLVAASTVAFSSSSGENDNSFNPCSNEVISCSSSRNGGISSSSRASLSLDKEKFAPRFDGLRFIETLVTAHR